MNSRIYRRHTRVSFRDVPAHERFWRNVDTTGGPSSCWLWTGTLTREGYARFRGPGKRQWLVHRYSFFIHRGISLPPSIPLDHICHNADKSCNLGNKCRHRSCVNPAHLEPTTTRQNFLNGRCPAKKERCIRGHPFSGFNLINRPNGRACRACRTLRSRAYRRRCYDQRKNTINSMRRAKYALQKAQG